MPTIPVINSVRQDSSSYTIKIDGFPYDGITALSYDAKLSPVMVYGLRSVPIGRTRGKQECSGSLEMLKSDAVELLSRLRARTLGQLPPRISGTGVCEVEFDIVVECYEPSQGLPKIDVLKACRLTSLGLEVPGTGTGEPAKVKFELSIMDILVGTTLGPTMVSSDPVIPPV